MKKVRMTEDLIEEISVNMPSGSGIDCDYRWTKSRGKLILHNEFHNINDNGYYDGYSPFKVHIIVKYDGELILDKIRFAKRQTSNSVYRKYSNWLLRDYLYDTFQNAVDDYNSRSH